MMQSPIHAVSGAATLPRLGFAGVGWIGRHRLRSLADAGAGEVVALADPDRRALEETVVSAPAASCFTEFEALLDMDLDGIVIATPSGLHARQAVAALERGVAVFCQKPLTRTAGEAAQVIAAAERSARPLAVDLSYRFTAGMRRIRVAAQAGELGKIFAVDLVFHNAYGPGNAWFADPRLSGGGCVIDLGTHLVDLALWTLGFPKVEHVTSRLLRRGEPLADGESEDFAVAEIELEGGVTVRLACSWHHSAGQDATIEATFHGTDATASFRNCNGSFYDFMAELYHGRQREMLSAPPDSWDGRAIVAWAQRLARGDGFGRVEPGLVQLAETIDAIYRR